MIDAAIVGLGRWGQRLVDSVQVAGQPRGHEIRFTHAVVRSPEKSAGYAESQRLQLSADLKDVLTDPAVQAVVLATPHEVHAEQIERVLNAGKHVFVEKPLALDGAHARAAVHAAQRADRVLAVGHNRRFLPAAAALKAMLGAGQLGQLLHVEGNFSNASGLAYQAAMWRSGEKGVMAGMTAMGIHVLDFLIGLCGPVAAVRASGARLAMPVDADDVVMTNLRFRSGVTGYLSTLLTTPRQWRVQLFGTIGWAHLRDEHLLDLCDAQGRITTTDFGPVDTVRLELEAFADAIAGGKPFPISPEEMAHVPAVLRAVIDSASSDEQVILPDT